jgi:small-conductance mechanosensitive channel
LIANIIASRFIKQEYKLGNKVEFDEFSGEIASVDLFAIKIKQQDIEVIIPNSVFIGKIVKRVVT